MRRADQQGFSLLEVLIVIVILGLLSMFAITSFWLYKEKAEYAKAESTYRSMRTAIEVGDQEADVGSSVAYAETVESGGPVSGALADLLPGGTTPNGVIVGASFEYCDGASGAMDVRQFLAVKACKADKQINFTRFCGGIEIFTPNIAGSGC